MTDITSVKGETAHSFYKWVKNTKDFQPKWNFYKILINKDGEVIEFLAHLQKT